MAYGSGGRNAGRDAAVYQLFVAAATRRRHALGSNIERFPHSLSDSRIDHDLRIDEGRPNIAITMRARCARAGTKVSPMRHRARRSVRCKLTAFAMLDAICAPRRIGCCRRAQRHWRRTQSLD